MARKSSKSTPTIIDGLLYTNDPEETGINLKTEWNWFYGWLEDNPSFYFQHETGGFSARRQHHGNGWFWYAYKRISGRLFKVYLGGPEALTLDKLTEAACQWPEVVKKWQSKPGKKA